MPEFRRVSEIDAPTDSVFTWHTRSGAFERLAPPWTPTEVVERHGRPPEPGSRLILRARLGPVWRRWTAEHRDWVPGRLFTDHQVDGPFASWVHTHRFDPIEGQRTRLEDHVVYRLPFGIIGRVGQRYAQCELTRMFGYRHRVTARDVAWHHRYGGPQMNVMVTGSSGMVGSALVAFLRGGGHTVRRLLRRSSQDTDVASWDPTTGAMPDGTLDGIDAVVHLAGESIAGGRWTSERKQRIRDSRVIGTRHLAEALASARVPPKVLVAASAIGYYGDRGDQVLDESAAPGEGFLSDVCQEWEAAAEPARQAGIRVVHLRVGIVLSPQGGALAQMLLPFKLGVGGVLGSGRQYMSWIALDDVLGVVLHALKDDQLSGAVNAVAPHPVTNRVFTKTLGRVLSRPTIFPVPGFAARLAFGEMADALLLASTRVVPGRLIETSFPFGYPEIESALRHVLGRAGRETPAAGPAAA